MESRGALQSIYVSFETGKNRTEFNFISVHVNYLSAEKEVLDLNSFRFSYSAIYFVQTLLRFQMEFLRLTSPKASQDLCKLNYTLELKPAYNIFDLINLEQKQRSNLQELSSAMETPHSEGLNESIPRCTIHFKIQKRLKQHFEKYTCNFTF